MIVYHFFFRSLRTMLRSFMGTLMMFIFPVAFFIFFALLLNSDFDAPDIKIAVDTSTVSASLVRSLELLDEVEVINHFINDESIPSELAEGGFSAYVRKEGGVSKAFVDSGQERILSLLLRAAHFQAENGSADPAETVLIELVDVEPAFMRYSISGLFAMALIQLMIYGTASTILTERASGTWRLLSTLPVSTIHILVGEGASRLIVATLQMLLLYGLVVVFVGIEFNQNPLPFVLMSLVSAVMCVTLGVAVGGGLPDERWGIHVLTFLSLFMLFFGNIFSPMHNIPGLKILVYANPITYSAEAIRWALVGTPSFLPPFMCMLVMILWTIIGLIGVRLTFRYETVTTTK